MLTINTTSHRQIIPLNLWEWQITAPQFIQGTTCIKDNSGKKADCITHTCNSMRFLISLH